MRFNPPDPVVWAGVGERVGRADEVVFVELEAGGDKVLL